MDQPQTSYHSQLPRQEPAKVLVVEDTAVTTSLMSRTLAARGHLIAEACDGHQALKLLASAKFDAILLDLAMPNIDRWHFRQAQLRFPTLARIPTIVVTERPLGEYERDALRTPYVVVKPFAERGLVSVLDRALGLGEQHAVTP